MSRLTINQINGLVHEDAMALVQKEEVRYHRKVDMIVDTILEQNIEILFLAGPSGSGKTTTAHKITKKLKEHGRKAYFVSLDDFYREGKDYPLLPDGSPDFETVHALDLPLFHQTFEHIEEHGFAYMPKFHFPTSSRKVNHWKLDVKPGDIIVVEGLHALNPLITDNLTHKKSYKLYISVSSRIYNHKRKVILSKRDLRFIRRLVRDYHFRASSVDNTYQLWQQVQVGEDQYLFPFRDRADQKMNSIHMYEPCLFKDIAISMLMQMDTDSEHYNDAYRLIQTLKRFETITKPSIPEDSLLREFVG